jgi:hypothetical protein
LLNRWIEREGKFFRTVGRNAIVRATLRVRGLDDDELARGWALYSELLGFGPTATISSAQDTLRTSSSGKAVACHDLGHAPEHASEKSDARIEADELWHLGARSWCAKRNSALPASNGRAEA